MSNHNYSQYSNKNKNFNKTYMPKQSFIEQDNVAIISDPVIEEDVTIVTTVSAPAEPMEIKMENKPVVESKIVKGVVANCAKLNVRAEPKVTADIVCVLDNNSEMEINADKSNKDWYAVCTATGVEGYCMRKFVNVKM